jgi:hypothetical protein
VSDIHFYCQNLAGDKDFSIEEWNEVYKSVQNLSESDQRKILDDPPPCEEQCFACMAIVGEQRIKTSKLTGNPNDSPARMAYLEWKKNGKPKFNPSTLTLNK